MAVHKPWDRPFFVVGGSVMRNGFSLNLAEGQFGVCRMSKTSPKGAVVLDEFKGFGKDELFELRLGNKQKLSRTTSNKMYSSFPFHLKDIMDLKVSVPKRTEMSVDDVIIGYDGINPDTSLMIYPGEDKEISLKLSGKVFEYMGIPEGCLDVVVPLSSELAEPKRCKDICEEVEPVDMLPVIKNVVKFIKDYHVYAGNNLEEFIEVTPIIKLDGYPEQGKYVEVKYCLSVCDSGDKGALALVQQQYPNMQVVLKERKGSLSTYEVTLRGKSEGEVPTKPQAYTQTMASLIKGCKDCPSGYEAHEGGFVYAVSLEDDGEDKSSVVEGLENAVAGSAVKPKGQNGGQGMYVVVLSKKLSDDKFKEFVDANPTATVSFVDKVSSLCSSDEKSTVEWAECGRCNFSTREFKIILPDTECGESRLEELKEFYPNLEIEETGVKGGCQREYKTKTFTNTVCDECDDIYKDVFGATAPIPFENTNWESVVKVEDGKDGLYGIRLRGKKIKISSGECLRDKIGYVEDSVKIQATGGYITDDNWSTTGGRVEDRPFNVTYLSRYSPRTHVAGNMLYYEDYAKTFFTGRLFNHDYMGRILTGNESNIVDLDAQTVDYAITIKRDIFSQGLSQMHQDVITYHVVTEVGSHQDVEEVLNALASAGGVEPVQALPTV